MLILIDQDGPLADFDLGFLTEWRASFPDRPCVQLTRRTAFHVRDDYPPSERTNVESIYFAPDFYRNLPPVPGAIDAVRRMRDSGHHVYICTSPLSGNEHCIPEKQAWVAEHLGREFIRNLIVAKDKTLVRGDILIDDRPDVDGSLPPTWEHVLFEKPYNRTVIGKRRISWGSWQAVLADVERDRLG